MRNIAARPAEGSGSGRNIMTSGETSAARLAAVSTATVNDARKFDYFCDAICDVYAGIQPVQSDDGIFNAEFQAVAVSSGVLATISAPGHMADRGSRELRRRPDDSLFLNFSAFSSYGAWHAGEHWQVSAGRPFLIDNDRPFHLDFDRTRRMVLYSLRFDRSAIGTGQSIADVNRAIVTTELGRHLALQMRLMCQALQGDRIDLAGMMSNPVLGLLSLIADTMPAGSERLTLAEIESIARFHIAEPDFAIDQLARLFSCTARTIQSRFAENGTTFSR
jgi:AraC family transcriptional activator of tynA and feaB